MKLLHFEVLLVLASVVLARPSDSEGSGISDHSASNTQTQPPSVNIIEFIEESEGAEDGADLDPKTSISPTESSVEENVNLSTRSAHDDGLEDEVHTEKISVRESENSSFQLSCSLAVLGLNFL